MNDSFTNTSESLNSTETNFNNSDSLNSTEPNLGLGEPQIWAVVIFVVFMVVIMVLAVLGNGVILVVEQFNKQKTSTDWLVTFMSVNDLVLSCNVPIYILFYAGDWERVGSSALCGFMAYIQETCSYASTLLLVVTSLDRYVKTCHPHTKGITPRRSMYICIGVMVFTLPFTGSIPFISHYVDGKCIFITTPETRRILQVLIMFLQATYMLSFIAVIASYCKIAHTIRTRMKARKRNGHRQGLGRDPGGIQLASQMENSVSQTMVTRITANNKVSPLFAEPSAAFDADISHDIAKPAHGENGDSTSVFAISENQHNNTDQTDGDGPSQNQAQKRRRVKIQRDSKEAQMNKTTAIMFAVTIVFILSWIPPWLLPNLVSDPTLVLLCRRTFMVNTCTNPLFYITMSSAFRNLTKQTLRKVWYRLQMALGVVREV